MNVNFKNFNCPYCGSHELTHKKEDIFYCEYCKADICLDIDNLDISQVDKITLEEIKQFYSEKVTSLRLENSKEKKAMNYFINKRDCPKLIAASYVALVVGILVCSVLFALYEISNAYTIIGAVLFVGVISFFIAAQIFKRLRYKKYYVTVLYCASIVSEYEEEIAEYTKILSKLQK